MKCGNGQFEKLTNLHLKLPQGPIVSAFQKLRIFYTLCTNSTVN